MNAKAVEHWMDMGGKAFGSVAFLETEPYYADNDLGNGARFEMIVQMGLGPRRIPVMIQWTAWNRFTWIQA